MTALLLTFVLAFVFSFIGSIPPGTLNLTSIQLGLEGKTDVATRFAIGAALTEYPYAWLAIELQHIITNSPIIGKNLELLTGAVMIALGLFNYFSGKKPTKFSAKFNSSGFRRGLLLGIFNPLAFPFWIAMTAYLRSLGWITLATQVEKHLYLLGITVGAFVVLVIIALLAKKVIVALNNSEAFKRIPATILLILGLYAVLHYFLR